MSTSFRVSFVGGLETFSDEEVEYELRICRMQQEFVFRPELPLCLRVVDKRPSAKPGRQTRIRRVERPNLPDFVERVLRLVSSSLDTDPGMFRYIEFEFPHSPDIGTTVEVRHG